MSRKKRGLARGREIMLDKVHSFFYKNYSLLFPLSPPFIVHLLFRFFILYIFSLDLIHGFD